MYFENKRKQEILELCYKAIEFAEEDLIEAAIIPLSNHERFEEQATVQFDLNTILIFRDGLGTSLTVNGKFCNDIDKY